MREKLIKKYLKAQHYFTFYIMKMNYGDPKDIKWNCEMANCWDDIIYKLRKELYEN